MKKLILILSILFIFQLLLMSRVTACGEKIADLDAQISRLEEENQKLEVKIASNLSYRQIAQKAVEAGFLPVSDRLDREFSMAIRR